MSDEAYPLQGIDRDEELLSFSGSAEEQACIGYLRGDFGGGTEFWTTWWDHHEELKGQALSTPSWTLWSTPCGRTAPSRTSAAWSGSAAAIPRPG